MPQKITQEKITQIIKLREFGCTFNDICKITKSSKEQCKEYAIQISRNMNINP
jgi:hypothetical protein